MDEVRQAHMRMPKLMPFGYLIALITAAVFVYLNSLGNLFVYDDIPGIIENRLISRPWRYMWDPAGLFNSISFALARYNPAPYHMFSVGLHALNTLLVYIFLRLFFREDSCFLAALLFAVHPANTEAVVWISARGYETLGTCVLMTYICYHTFVSSLPLREGTGHGAGRMWYFAALGIFAYFIKQNYSFFFVMPLVLAASDAIFGRIRSTLKYLAPFFIIAIIRLATVHAAIAERMSSAAAAAQGGMMPVEAGVIVNPWPRFIYSVFYHAGLLLWPARLCIYHEPIALAQEGIWFGSIALMIGAFFIPAMRRSGRVLLLALVIFALFLAPTYSPVVVTSLIAERYLYVPSIALCMVAAFVFEKYGRKIAVWRPAYGVFLCLLAALAARTMLRNEDWKTPAVFWRKSLASAPANAYAHHNMGFVYQQEGNTAAAQQEYVAALAINPGIADAYNNLGAIYMAAGKMREALACFEKLIAVDPKFVKAYNNIGSVYSRLGRSDDALRAYQAALRLNPDYATAYFNMAGLYRAMGDERQAQVVLRKALALDPSLGELL